MRHVPTLWARELAAYFLSPMAYLILLAFQVIAWYGFVETIDELTHRRDMFSVLANPMNSYIVGSTPFWIAILVAVPALTMRLIAEERRSGTIETLLTVPVTEAEVVVAKWLAGVTMYWVLLLPFLIYLPFLYYVGKYHFDPGPLIPLALGLTTMGMMFVAIGLFFSSLTRNQIVAAIQTFSVLFLLVLLAVLGLREAMVQRNAALGEVVRFTALLYQLRSLASGQLDVRFLALHLSVTVFMLYLAVKVLQFRTGR
jgi:ABC-2 type transport system permease protein